MGDATEHTETPDPWLGRAQAPIGFGAGSYAAGDARDLGAPAGPPARVLPGLRDGTYQATARTRALGDQATLDSLVGAGEGWLAVEQAPYGAREGD